MTSMIEQLEAKRGQLINAHRCFVEQAEATGFYAKRIKAENEAEALLKEIGRVTVELQAARLAATND